jgi:hypothetical protein
MPRLRLVPLLCLASPVLLLAWSAFLILDSVVRLLAWLVLLILESVVRLTLLPEDLRLTLASAVLVISLISVVPLV